jgi:site-specific recombinase XerD
MSEIVEQRRQYTSKDFAALRAFVQRLDPAVIARTYYSTDEDVHASTPGAMERYLRAMLDTLVKLAIEHGSSVLADHLKTSIRRHGSARLTAVSLKMVEQAAQIAIAVPAASHGVGMWFRPMVSRHLREQQITTLGELVHFCNRRGGSWWRAVRRIGPGRARRVVAWLRRHETTIGLRVEPDVDELEPFAAKDGQTVEIGGTRATLAPLERMSVHAGFSGATGENRSTAFAFVRARNDLEAVRAYLHQYRDQPKTLRAYTKELERFLLWAVCVLRRPLSSVLVEDCEAYKDFLKAPSPSFVGPRATRSSRRWRPFASPSPSPETQRYAVRALRAAFTWLVDVRYLAGNPWKAVNDPTVVQSLVPLKIGRALPPSLWSRMRRHVDLECEAPDATQWRVVRVILLLGGDSGLRREEMTTSRREFASPALHEADDPTVWQLQVLGKRKRLRMVPVSAAGIDALRAHWLDRGQDFDIASEGPLLKPLVIPHTPQALRKHGDGTEHSYSPDSINDLIKWAMKQLIARMTDLSIEEKRKLSTTTPHAFRHTFGTEAMAHDVPLDVVQRILGHLSLQTTTIYVQAEHQRMIQAAAAYFADQLKQEV